jgi:hypothetical protein
VKKVIQSDGVEVVEQDVPGLKSVMERGGIVCPICMQVIEDDAAMAILISPADSVVGDMLTSVGIHRDCMEKGIEDRTVFAIHKHAVTKAMSRVRATVVEAVVMGMSDSEVQL